jgi:hypothetical protein
MSNGIIKIPKDLEYTRRKLISQDETKKASDVVFELLRDNYRLADSTPFFRLATGNADVAEISLVSFVVPTGVMGVLKFFGQGAKTANAFNFVTWRIMRNGTPYADFGNLTGQVGSISNPKSVTERLVGGDTIEIRVVAAVGGPYEVYGSLEGWYWPV